MVWLQLVQPGVELITIGAEVITAPPHPQSLTGAATTADPHPQSLTGAAQPPQDGSGAAHPQSLTGAAHPPQAGAGASQPQLGAGASHPQLGAGSQQDGAGAGAQQVGAGSQQVGAGSQQGSGSGQPQLAFFAFSLASNPPPHFFSRGSRPPQRPENSFIPPQDFEPPHLRPNAWLS
ncbi:MAG: hypothetical protein AAGG44_11740 [Planctomycetota bacterium]